MADFSLHDVDDIKYRKRRPWLLIVLLVAAVAFLWFRFGRDETAPKPVKSESKQAVPKADEPAREDPPPLLTTPANVQDLLSKAAAAEARREQEQGWLSPTAA